ncbi:hypothetical protein SEA_WILLIAMBOONE_130 [Gordonia phage WilliamBoone]|nr:hypothetical protein SEA_WILLIAMBOONE_130 [Gordonia phage WilliamBoone]
MSDDISDYYATGGLILSPAEPTFEYAAEFFENFAAPEDVATSDLLDYIEINSNAGKWTRVPADHPAEVIESVDEDTGVKVFVVLREELTRVRSYYDEQGNQWLREYEED